MGPVLALPLIAATAAVGSAATPLVLNGTVTVTMFVGTSTERRAQYRVVEELQISAPLRLLREARMSTSVILTLYHQTSRVCAAAICESQRMYCGQSGLAGGGIYFAASPEATMGKAHRTGVILKALVRLGKSMRLSKDGNSELTLESLLEQGYDSVIIDRPGGIEYVVYHWDQVTNIEVERIC
jgi:hypothetical protein